MHKGQNLGRGHAICTTHASSVLSVALHMYGHRLSQRGMQCLDPKDGTVEFTLPERVQQASQHAHPVL